MSFLLFISGQGAAHLTEGERDRLVFVSAIMDRIIHRRIQRFTRRAESVHTYVFEVHEGGSDRTTCVEAYDELTAKYLYMLSFKDVSPAQVLEYLDDILSECSSLTHSGVKDCLDAYIPDDAKIFKARRSPVTMQNLTVHSPSIH